MAYFQDTFSYNAGLPTLKRWLENRNSNKMIGDYFLECGYRNIAICDSGEIGLLLFEEVIKSNINVVCFIDRNSEGLEQIDGIPVISLNKIESLDIDVVVVCPPENYSEVSKYLVRKKNNTPTIYLKDAVYEM